MDQSVAPNILILTILKDATSWGQNRSFKDYIAMIKGISYPLKKISIEMLVSDKTEFEDISKMADELNLQTIFRDFRVHYHKDPQNTQDIPRERRKDDDIQHARRSMLARIRNELLKLSDIENSQGVCWIDSDLIYIPDNLLSEIVKSNKDIVMPFCGEGTDKTRDYDLNAYRIARGQKHHLKTMYHNDPSEPFVEIDSVGGTFLFVKSKVHLGGVLFSEKPVKNRLGQQVLETEGICIEAKRRGFTCWFMNGEKNAVLHFLDTPKKNVENFAAGEEDKDGPSSVNTYMVMILIILGVVLFNLNVLSSKSKILIFIAAAFLILTSPRFLPRSLYERFFCEEVVLPPVEERVTVQAITQRSPTVNFGHAQLIPKVIYQTNEHAYITQGMAKSVESILTANPDYEYRYFDNVSARNFIAENFRSEPSILKAYDIVIPGAYKADIFRYCLLYKLGGVYIDMGFVAKAPLRELIGPTDVFISPEDNGTGGMYNAFICCVPNHPVIWEAIVQSVNNILNRRYGENPLAVTGPYTFAKAFRNVTHLRVKPGLVIKNNDETRILTYIRKEICTTGGVVMDNNDRVFFSTRYPGYNVDRLWYNTNKHYSDMWNERDIYLTDEE